MWHGMVFCVRIGNREALKDCCDITEEPATHFVVMREF